MQHSDSVVYLVIYKNIYMLFHMVYYRILNAVPYAVGSSWLVNLYLLVPSS